MKFQRILILLIIFFASANASMLIAQPVDPKRESPRATLQTFYNAFQQPRIGVTPDPLQEAVKCLDLEEVPAEYRAVKGLEISTQLKELLNWVGNFQVHYAPNNTDGEAHVIYRSQKGEITIARQANGEWLFTRETIRSIPLLLSEAKGTGILLPSDSMMAPLLDSMPSIMKERTLMFERWQWLGLFLLVVFGVIVWQIVKLFARAAARAVLQRRFPYLTDELVRKISSPVGLLAFVIVCRLGLSFLVLTQDSLSVLLTITFLLTAFAVTWLLYRLIDLGSARLKRKAEQTQLRTDDLLVPFVSTVVRIAVVIIAAVWVAGNLRFDVTSLIAGLGIGGIAIALASQETLSNFFGSLVLLIERPFTADDRVEIGGIKGTIQEIGLRSTKILTYDHALITMPNASIAKSNILNQGLRISPRWSIKLFIPYKNGAVKIEKFCAGIEEIIKANDTLLEDSFKVHLYDVLPASLELRVQVTFKVDEIGFEMEGRHRFILELLRLADKLEIDMEVPN